MWLQSPACENCRELALTAASWFGTGLRTGPPGYGVQLTEQGEWAGTVLTRGHGGAQGGWLGINRDTVVDVLAPDAGERLVRRFPLLVDLHPILHQLDGVVAGSAVLWAATSPSPGWVPNDCDIFVLNENRANIIATWFSNYALNEVAPEKFTVGRRGPVIDLTVHQDLGADVVYQIIIQADLRDGYDPRAEQDAEEDELLAEDSEESSSESSEDGADAGSTPPSVEDGAGEDAAMERAEEVGEEDDGPAWWFDTTWRGSGFTVPFTAQAAGIEFGATAGFDVGCVQFGARPHPVPVLTPDGTVLLFRIVATPAGIDALRERALTHARWETKQQRIEKYHERVGPLSGSAKLLKYRVTDYECSTFTSAGCERKFARRNHEYE